MNEIWIVWMRDLDMSSKFCSAWSSEQAAWDECRSLQMRDFEVAYFVTCETVQ